MKILLLDVPGLHLGFLGCYGNDWIATPNLDRLAAEGVVFDQHFADQPDGFGAYTGRFSLPAAGNADTFSRLAETLRNHQIPARIQRLESWSLLTERTETFLEELTENNRGIVWLEGPSLAPPWNLPADLLDSYFEEEEREEEDRPWPDPPLGRTARLNDDDVLRLQNTYAAAVTFLDAQIGLLLKFLASSPAAGNLLLVITARTGLSLGEHDWIGPGYSRLHEEVCHLPLILKFPGNREAGLRIPGLTQPVDLLPTFIRLWGLPTEEFQGKDLLALIEGETSDLRPLAFTLGTNEEWAVRGLEWTLLGNPAGNLQLFARPEDRWERNDLGKQNPETLDELVGEWNQFLTALRQ